MQREVMQKLQLTAVIVTWVLALLAIVYLNIMPEPEPEKPIEVTVIEYIPKMKPITSEHNYKENMVDEQERHYVPVIHAETVQYDSIDLLRRCVQAEAGNQCLEGKQAVANVVLNRVNHAAFPGSVYDVIMQPGQFGVVSNGSINSVTPDVDTYEAVDMALQGLSVIPSDYVYFNTSPNGADPIQIQDHYFCR